VSGPRLGQRRILITGGASGIGLAIAILFQEEGARVALLDRDEAGLRRAADSLRASGGTPVIVVGDVTERASVDRAVGQAVEALDGLDGLLNGAGISLRKSFENTSFEEWREVLSINLDGAFHVTQAALPALKAANGAAIVNIASGSSFRPGPDFSAYCASKGGLMMLSRALAVDLNPYRIRVNAVCPGPILTPMVERSLASAPDQEAAMRAYVDPRLMRRLGEAREVAYAALHLMSDEASYTTGASIAVDGGSSFH
jgi:NAD(P)-dependent dehydrogenase (short-subunit alcohol dehydrogenase family)